MYTSSRGGLWLLRLRVNRLNLCIPVPLYVLGDLLQSTSDLCAVILPRLGLPNYAQAAAELLAAIGPGDAGEPLLDLQIGHKSASSLAIKFKRIC